MAGAARQRTLRHHHHPGGEVYYASLAGNYIAHIDVDRRGHGHRPTDQGPGRAPRVVRFAGRIWVSYWNTGQVGMYDPAAKTWHEWKLPGTAHTYAVWVDPHDKVWLTDWSVNAIVRFDPITESSRAFRPTAPRPTCGRCSAAAARCGARSRATTAW